MHRARTADASTRYFGWFLIALVLMVAPTPAGRGLLLQFVEGACPPDCACEDEDGTELHGAEAEGMRSESEAFSPKLDVDPHQDHDCALQPDSDECPPNCADCNCCAAPTAAVTDFRIPAFGAREKYDDIDVRGPPSMVRRTSRDGPYRPPKS